MKCADDMTDDSPYRCGVEQLSLWCNQNNLELNMLRNGDYSWSCSAPPPLASRCRYTLRNGYRQFHLYSLLRHCSILLNSRSRHSENTANYRADIRGEVKTRCKDIAELFWGGGGGFHKVSYFQTVETYSSR